MSWFSQYWWVFLVAGLLVLAWMVVRWLRPPTAHPIRVSFDPEKAERERDRIRDHADLERDRIRSEAESQREELGEWLDK